MLEQAEDLPVSGSWHLSAAGYPSLCRNLAELGRTGGILRADLTEDLAERFERFHVRFEFNLWVPRSI